MQLKISYYGNIIVEWIPYNQFKDIKEISINDSTALDDLLEYDRHYEKKWKRNPNSEVTLKHFYNSQNITNEFLNEV
jgi:hypothetical protein